MSKATDYMEKWHDLDRKQPRLRHEKGLIRENEIDPGFSAELNGKGIIVITQHDEIIKIDIDGARKFSEWIWKIFKEHDNGL